MNIVSTNRFGTISYEDRDLVIARGDLTGMSGLTKFIVVDEPSTKPFRWLQSVELGWMALPILCTSELIFDYGPQIPTAELLQIGLHSADKTEVYVVVTIPEDILRSSVNLRAPLVFNTVTRVVRQVVLDGDWPEELFFFDTNLDAGAPRSASAFERVCLN